MSTILHGKQMVPILNACGVDVACLGNHDLDFGVPQFLKLKSRCSFPWLCSNAKLKRSGKVTQPSVTEEALLEGLPLGKCDEYHMAVVGGVRVLYVGLVESEWLETLATISKESVDFVDSWAWAKDNIPRLRHQHNADLVVALAHQRMPQNYRLAEECGGTIDLILGGHDHHYEHTVKNGIHILNSGTDFRNYSVVDVTLNNGEKVVTVAERTVSMDGPQDPITQSLCLSFQDAVEKKMEKPIGRIASPLDARFMKIRTQETNISDFIADLMCKVTGAQVAILNSGSLRADRIIEPGLYTMRDFRQLLPMEDPLVVIQLTAKALLACLENGVSKYPALEGRFPCVSGVRFTFTASRPAGSRVVTAHLGDIPFFDNGTLLVPPDSTVSVVTKQYLAQGKDGYVEFASAPVLVNEENLPSLPTIVRNVFTQMKVAGAFHRLTSKHKHNFMKIALRSWEDKAGIRSATAATLPSPSLSLPNSNSIFTCVLDEVQDHFPFGLFVGVDGRIMVE